MKRILILAASIVLGSAPTALAHTALSKSTPAANASVASPTELKLEFGDSVKLARVQVVGPAGAIVNLPLDRAAPPSRQMTVKVTERLSAGPQTVKWRAIAADGHVMTGEFSFSVR